jgi:hypothetical protein
MNDERKLNIKFKVKKGNDTKDVEIKDIKIDLGKEKEKDINEPKEVTVDGIGKINVKIEGKLEKGYL